jgi:hypothetical protein
MHATGGGEQVRQLAGCVLAQRHKVAGLAPGRRFLGAARRHHLADDVTERLAGCREGTPERREALATLALIRRVIAQRQSHWPKPGF